jgi:hypothetical protein
MSTVQLPSSKTVYQDLQSKVAELESVKTEFVKSKEILNQAQAHYFSAGFNASKTHGTLLGYGGDNPVLIARVKASKERAETKAQNAKIIAKSQRDLAQKTVDELAKKISLLETEVRELQTSFSKACVIESQLKGVN